MKHLLLALSLVVALPMVPAFADPDPALQQHLDSAKQAMTNADYEQAIDELQEAQDASPADADIGKLLQNAKQKDCAQYVQQGQEALDAKNYDDALNDFGNALQVLPDDAAALAGQKAAQNWPHAEAYVKAALDYQAKGNFTYAVAYLQRAYDLVKDPSIAKLLSAAKAQQAKKGHK
ncbi:MAG TPA: hypothetical protein V6D47_13715 [Oscillatoriaceae cyanobacterium]